MPSFRKGRGVRAMTIIYDAKRKGGRSCGGCTLCCKLLPVPIFKKASGTPCQYQRFNKGCTIYARRPAACQYWSCRWLLSLDTAELRRPDRSHYVIDPMPDYVTMTDADGKAINVEVVQIWCDPDYPDAHRDPALRAYLERRAEQNAAALIRFDERRALFIVAPPMAGNRQWHEVEPHRIREERRPGEVEAALGLKLKVTRA